MSNNKKIHLVGAAALDKSPYIQTYIDLFEKSHIEYDLLCWNRQGEKTEDNRSNHYS